MINKFKNYLKQALKIVPSKKRKSLAFHISQTAPNCDLFDLDYMLGLSEDSEYIKIYREGLIKAGQEDTDNIYKTLRHMNLYNYVEDVLRKNVPGDFAECGCWKGFSIFTIKHFIDKYKSTKYFHVFDSFEGGLSEFKEKDFKGGFINSKERAEEVRGEFHSSYDGLLKNTENLSRLNVNKGWIPEVFENEGERSYSFVHIDVDLYEPTLASHRYFFNRLSKGGVIVCDDYGFRQFPGASDAVDEFIDSLPESSYSHFFKNSVGGSVIIK